MIRSKYEQFGNTSIWPYPCGVLDSFTVPLHSSNGSCARGLSPGGGGGGGGGGGTPSVKVVGRLPGTRWL